MEHYIVLVKDANKWELTYQGKEPFITTHKLAAEQFLHWIQGQYPMAEYKLISFNVEN